MTNILVQPPQLRKTAEQLRSHAQKMDQALYAVDDDMNSLKGNIFLGHRAADLQIIYASKRDALLNARQLILYFANELQTVANVFEKADNVIGASDQSSKLMKGEFVDDSSSFPWRDFYDADRAFLDIVSTFLGSRGEFKQMLKLLGMSKAYGFFKDGIPYRGSIDTLFRSARPWMFGINAVIGTLEDVYDGTYGDNILKAVGVNVLDTGMNALLSSNPYTGAALLINGTVQLAGNLGVGLDKIANDFIATDDVTRKLLLDQIEYKADALDKVDLGNITKSLSESICDGFIFTDSGRSDLVNTGKSVFNVFDGATELVVSHIVEPADFGVALLDRTVQALPVSDEFKHASTIVTHDTLKIGQDLMEGFVDLFEWR